MLPRYCIIVDSDLMVDTPYRNWNIFPTTWTLGPKLDPLLDLIKTYILIGHMPP